MNRHNDRGWQGICLLLAILLLQACSGLPRQGGGAWPSTAVLKRAALAAVKDPHTWVPATGAVVFAVSEWDEELSAWARREHPLFGSQADARQGSDVLLGLSAGGAVATALLVPRVPSGPSRLVVQLGAFAGSGAVTYAVKHAVGRERPDGSGDLGFPSGHAGLAFTGATLTRRNLAQLDLSPPAQGALDAGAIALAAGTAWARVEAGVHYPSDVLAGAALGNFMAAFINDAWLREGGMGEDMNRVSVLPLRRGALLRLSRRF